MIQVYKATNTNYEMNGDASLQPLSCDASFVLNDVWELELENPLDSNFELLTTGAVLSVPTPYGKKQLYRIYDYDKNDTSIIVRAIPIFLDSRNDCFLWDIRPTNKNGTDALNLMLAPNSKYHASSDITKTSTSYYVQKNFIEALNGNDENSFINRWGGEIAYNNFEIIVNERLGADNGLRVEFGFNLLGISEKVDMSDVVTRIVPKAYNGYILPNNETVDSPIINNYPIVYTKVIEYADIKMREDAQEDDEANGITVCDTLNQLYNTLRTRARQEYENKIDVPRITYNVDMVDLSKTDLYKDYKNLLTVNLGDTVHINHRKLNIVTTARVIDMEYDCITKKVKSLTLGDYEPNYFNDVSSVVSSAEQVINMSNNTLMGDKIAGVIDLLNTSLRAQKNISQKQDVRAILFEDLDPNSQTFGAMCLGTQGLQISKQRNTTNNDWVWGTSMDSKGIVASYIVTGLLSDKLGRNWWNLDTGEFVTRFAKIVSATITDATITNATISNVDINNADVSGHLESTSGNIGGFGISSGGFTKTTYKDLRKTYTSADVDRIRQIINRQIAPTSNDYYYYDTNGDGSITASDFLKVREMYVPAGNRIYTDVIINSQPYDENDINKPFVLVRYRGANGNTIFQSYISSRMIESTYLRCKTLTMDSLNVGESYPDSYNYFYNRSYFNCFNNKNEIGGQINAGYYNGTANLYVISEGYLSLNSFGNSISYDGRYVDDNWQRGKFHPDGAGVALGGTATHQRWYRVYSSNAASESSDERLKTKITQFDERFIKFFEMIEPVMYNWKSNENVKKEAGLIAQKVQLAMKECNITDQEFGCVDYGDDEDSYLALIYRHFQILTIYYVQYKEKEKNDRLDDLEKKLQQQQELIEKLSKEVKA